VHTRDAFILATKADCIPTEALSAQDLEFMYTLPGYMVYSRLRTHNFRARTATASGQVPATPLNRAATSLVVSVDPHLLAGAGAGRIGELDGMRAIISMCVSLTPTRPAVCARG